jgi:hypothetical protein
LMRLHAWPQKLLKRNVSLIRSCMTHRPRDSSLGRGRSRLKRDLCTGLSHFATATMPRPKGKGGKPVKHGKDRDDAADCGRSNLREAWAGGNYTRSSVSPEGSESSDVQNSIPFRLAMWDLGQCDKKRCTGTKLVRQQVVSELRLGIPFPGVILSPNGKCCVSNEDKELIGVKGLAVVDCSWNKLDEVPFGTLPEGCLCPWLH